MSRSRHALFRVSTCTVAAAFASMLTACGGGGSGDAVQLDFWTHTHPPMVELNEKLIAEFESENPDIDVAYQTIPNTEFSTKMLTSLSTGAGPDVINMDDAGLRGEYVPKELVAPVDPAAFDAGSAEELRERYVPGTLDGATGGDGTLYGLPSEFNAGAFAINTAHFEDAGLDPGDPPRTWQEVIEYGKELNAAGHEQAFNFLYLHEGWYHDWFSLLLNQTGGHVTSADGTQSTIDQPASVAALDLWVELARDSGIADPNTASREATAPYTDLATGTQSMAIVFPWAMEQIHQSNPETYEQLEVVPLPQLQPDDPSTFGYGYYWAVNSATEHPDEAWRFVSFLADHSERWLADASFVQPRADWTESDAAQELAFIDTWQDAYANAVVAEVSSHQNEVEEIIMEAVNGAVFDGVPPEQALQDADTAIEQSLG